MARANNIFLIGPMGTGKTTIGRQLAKRSGKVFYDSDQEIERQTGADIPLIFEIEGEAGFRKREADLLKKLARLDNIVLATGGGMVLAGANRGLLADNGFVIYLSSSPQKLYRRTASDRRRPLLQAGDRMTQIRHILQQREPLYTGLADLIIDTDRLTVKQILQKILDGMRQNEAD